MQPDLGDPLHEFEAVIEATLAGSGLRYERAASVTGLEADFIVRSPDDQSFVLLEAKPLLHEPAQVAMRALHLATRVREETGARRVLLVTPYPLPNRVAFESPALRVVDTDELAEALALEFARPTTQDGSFTVGSVISAGRLFAAMPFDAAFDDVFFVAIRAAAEDLGLGAYRVDYDDFSGDVVERIRVSIRESRVMVADLTLYLDHGPLEDVLHNTLAQRRDLLALRFGEVRQHLQRSL